MPNINIKVTNKRAIVEGSPVIVCGNSDYTVTFTFDDEWNLTGVRTARFVYIKDGVVQHEDRVFEGNTVEVPVLSNVTFVKVGVFAGELCTTTPARILCDPSILCGSGEVHEPTPDVYDQIMALFNDMAEQGAFGATEEQAQQIEQNRQGVETATAIAKGKNRARVFATMADMEVWLSDEANKGVANVGDNLYIVDVGVPDWWIAEKLEEPNEDGRYYEIAQLETQKVDLTPITALLGSTDISAIGDGTVTGGLDALIGAIAQICEVTFDNKTVLADANDAEVGRLYYINATTANGTGAYGILQTMLNFDGFKVQLAFGLTAVWIKSRFYNASTKTWSAWDEVAFNSDLSGYLPFTGGNMQGNINSQHIYPLADGTYNLGWNVNAWLQIFANQYRLYKNGVNYGQFYVGTEGTEEKIGYSALNVGNSRKVGEAGNAYGYINFFGQNSGATALIGTNNTDEHVTVKLPSSAGTLIRKENFYIDDDGYLVIDLDS